MIATVRALIDRGAVLDVLGLGTLDNSAQANLTLNMLAAISEFERQIISERTKAKLAQKKADGAKLGRPVKVDNAELKARAKDLLASGSSWRNTAKALDISLSTLQRMMKQQPQKQRPETAPLAVEHHFFQYVTWNAE